MAFGEEPCPGPFRSSSSSIIVQQQQQLQPPASTTIGDNGSNTGPVEGLSGMFSYLSGLTGDRRRILRGSSSRFGVGRENWSSNGGDTFSGGGLMGRSLWTKYCLLCTLCGSAATILAGIFLVVAALFRYYTTSINYFETVPTYIPAILLSIVGVSTIAFSCKRNRNIILLRITACWSLLSAAISSVITITTSVVHMNRLQTLKECVYNPNPPSCSCYSHHVTFPLHHHLGSPNHPDEGSTYVFENTPDCDVVHGVLYTCLRAVFAISVVAVLLSIFLCMLLYTLIGHERKKAYWSRIRRINSDWSADFIACLAARPPEVHGGHRSSVLPLVMSPTSLGGWVGPPPPYEEVATEDPPTLSTRPFLRPLFQGPAAPQPPIPRAPLRLVNSHSENSFTTPSPHPFSPTITSVPAAADPIALLRSRYHQQQQYIPQSQSQGDMAHHQQMPSSSYFMGGGYGCSSTFSSTTSSSFMLRPNPNPNNQILLSISSITSLSIPETLKSSTSFNDTEDCFDYDAAEMEDLVPEGGEEATCKSASGSVFEQDSLEEEDEVLKDNAMSSTFNLHHLERQIRLLEERLLAKKDQEETTSGSTLIKSPSVDERKLSGCSGNNNSFRGLSNRDLARGRKTSSVPCSPIMRVRKGLNRLLLQHSHSSSVPFTPVNKRKPKRPSLSFANVNFDFEANATPPGRSVLLRRGSSCPTSPTSKSRKNQQKIIGKSEDFR